MYKYRLDSLFYPRRRAPVLEENYVICISENTRHFTQHCYARLWKYNDFSFISKHSITKQRISFIFTDFIYKVY